MKVVYYKCCIGKVLTHSSCICCRKVCTHCLIPTMSAISFLAVFFWSKAKICDLCSKINWWYICNTELVNLWETSVSFFLYCWLFLFPLREMQTTSRYASRTSASLGEGHSFISLRFGTCTLKYMQFSFIFSCCHI